MNAEERLVVAYRNARRVAVRAEHTAIRRRVLRASGPMSEVELIQAHGMTLAQAVSVIASIPRRRCPCADHGSHE